MAHKRAAAAVLAAALGLAAQAAAQDVSFSAKVDKTSAPVGSPITLILTVAGDLQDVNLQPITVPDAFAIIARSQSTNFALQAGAIQRSTSLSYVLLPRRVGTFKLGPFSIKRAEKMYDTEPVEITVTEAQRRKPEPSGERFLL